MKKKQTNQETFSVLSQELGRMRRELEPLLLPDPKVKLYAHGGREMRYSFAQFSGTLSPEGVFRAVYAQVPRWGELQEKAVLLPYHPHHLPVVLQIDRTPIGFLVSYAPICEDGRVGKRTPRLSDNLTFCRRSRQEAMEALSRFTGQQVARGETLTTDETLVLNLGTFYGVKKDIHVSEVIPTKADVRSLRERPGDLQRFALFVLQEAVETKGIKMPTVPEHGLRADESADRELESKYL